MGISLSNTLSGFVSKEQMASGGCVQNPKLSFYLASSIRKISIKVFNIFGILYINLWCISQFQYMLISLICHLFPPALRVSFKKLV